MAIRLSEHLMLSDASIGALDDPGDADIDLTVTLPAGFVDTAGNEPLLSFQLDTSDTVSGLTFTVESTNDNFANTVLEFTGEYNSNVAHAVQEVINIGSFTTAGTNGLRFSYTAGTGTLNISDVVLLVKRDAAEINTGTGTV